jgi:hypothetical protein
MDVPSSSGGLPSVEVVSRPVAGSMRQSDIGLDRHVGVGQVIGLVRGVVVDRVDEVGSQPERLTGEIDSVLREGIDNRQVLLL